MKQQDESSVSKRFRNSSRVKNYLEGHCLISLNDQTVNILEEHIKEPFDCNHTANELRLQKHKVSNRSTTKDSLPQQVQYK